MVHAWCIEDAFELVPVVQSRLRSGEVDLQDLDIAATCGLCSPTSPPRAPCACCPRPRQDSQQAPPHMRGGVGDRAKASEPPSLSVERKRSKDLDKQMKGAPFREGDSGPVYEVVSVEYKAEGDYYRHIVSAMQKGTPEVKSWSLEEVEDWVHRFDGEKRHKDATEQLLAAAKATKPGPEFISFPAKEKWKKDKAGSSSIGYLVQVVAGKSRLNQLGFVVSRTGMGTGRGRGYAHSASVRFADGEHSISGPGENLKPVGPKADKTNEIMSVVLNLDHRDGALLRIFCDGAAASLTLKADRETNGDRHVTIIRDGKWGGEGQRSKHEHVSPAHLEALVCQGIVRWNDHPTPRRTKESNDKESKKEKIENDDINDDGQRWKPADDDDLKDDDDDSNEGDNLGGTGMDDEIDGDDDGEKKMPSSSHADASNVRGRAANPTLLTEIATIMR